MITYLLKNGNIIAIVINDQLSIARTEKIIRVNCLLIKYSATSSGLGKAAALAFQPATHAKNEKVTKALGGGSDQYLFLNRNFTNRSNRCHQS